MEISKLYVDGHSIAEISRKTKISKYFVLKNLKLNKIKIRNLSESLSSFYKKNPDKHSWKKSNKFKSNPCEFFKGVLLKNNIPFISEYSEFGEKHYSIDIAMPDYKIGFEINGNQHYEKDGELKKYYIERELFIKTFNWKLYQIHYSICYNEDLVIKMVKDAMCNGKIDFDFNYKEYLIKKLNNKKPKKVYKNKKCIDCQKEIHNKNKRCRRCFDISQQTCDRPGIEQLLKDIEEFGYLSTGKKYGVTDNAIRKWVKWSKKVYN